MRRRAGALGIALLVLAACGRVRRPDTLVVLQGRDVEGLDPHLSGGIWQTQSVLANVYEGLVAFDDRMALVPALASSWSNPDETTWDFRLRPGVRFQTGAPLEARDVVFSLLRARDDPRSSLRAALAGVTEVAALPDGGVRVRTERPDGYLAARLREAWIVSRRFVAREGEAGFARASCGTGPYRLERWTPGESVDLVRFDGCWRGRAPIRRARFVARDFDSADAMAFVPPRARLLWMGFPGSPGYQRALEEGSPRFGGSLSVSYLGFDLHGDATPGVRAAAPGNPFRDARVREAVARTVRLAALAAERKGEGYFPTQLVPPVVFGYDPGIAPAVPDPDAARRLLAATPWKAGFDVDLDVRSAMRGYEGLADELAAVGIRAHPRVSSDDAFFQRMHDHATSLYVLRFSCRTGDAQELFDKWAHSRDERRGLGVYNFSWDASPVPGLDAEIDAARGELNPMLRKERLQAIMRRLMAEHVVVPLFTEKDYTFASRDVVFASRADSFRLVAEMRFAK